MSAISMKCRLSKTCSNDSTREADAVYSAGDKRLFSKRESRQQDKDSKIMSHCVKRQRSGNWRLEPEQRSSNEKISSTQSCSPQPRSSKFLEGSMHDRVSQRPPEPYLDVDEISSQESQILKQNAITGTSITDRSESRNSIYRIRKSIAASFNLGSWKVWSKDHVLKKDEENAKRRLMDQRQEKAEKAYNEYKRTGFFGNSYSRSLPRSQSHSKQVHEKETPLPLSLKHDSGIELGEKRSTLVQVNELKCRPTLRAPEIDRAKRQGRIFIDPPNIMYHDIQNQEEHLSPSNSATCSYYSSPTQKNSRIKTSSLINIRKAFMGNSSTNILVSDESLASKIPSRRDIQKQQKLFKRVSNLEVKLNLAKRQLAMASSAFVDNDSIQASPSRENPSIVPEQLSPTNKLRTNSMTQNCQAECANRIFRERRRAVSLEATPQRLPTNRDSHVNKFRNRSSSWNNKPLPKEPTLMTNHIISNIDMDLLPRNISYFSDSDSEEFKRYSKDRDFFQKFSHLSRKNKDEADPANKRKISLFPSTREVPKISTPNQAKFRKSSHIKRFSKETAVDEKSSDLTADGSNSPLVSQYDIFRENLRDSIQKPQSSQLHETRSAPHRCSSPFHYSEKIQSSPRNSTIYCLTSRSPLSCQSNFGRLDEKDIPMLPHPTQVERSLTEVKDMDMPLRDSDETFPRKECISSAEAYDVDKDEEIIDTRDFDHDHGIQEQRTCPRTNSPKESKKSPIWTSGKSGLSSAAITTENYLNDDLFEWPEDVF